MIKRGDPEWVWRAYAVAARELSEGLEDPNCWEAGAYDGLEHFIYVMLGDIPASDADFVSKIARLIKDREREEER